MTKLRYNYRLGICYIKHIHSKIFFLTEVVNAVQHLKHFEYKAIELYIVFNKLTVYNASFFEEQPLLPCLCWKAVCWHREQHERESHLCLLFQPAGEWPLGPLVTHT